VDLARKCLKALATLPVGMGAWVYMKHELGGDMQLGFRVKLDFFLKSLVTLFKTTSTGEAKSKLRTATPKTSSLQGMS
jgi:hypothetical protein